MSGNITFAVWLAQRIQQGKWFNPAARLFKQMKALDEQQRLYNTAVFFFSRSDIRMSPSSS